MSYTFETCLNRGNKELLVEIEFDYFLPPKFVQWQDKAHGSIRIVFIKNQFTREPVNDLAIEEQIQSRRACWEYLERRSLLLRPNVIDIYT